MTRKELVSILLTHGLGGVADPNIRVATGPNLSEDFTVQFVHEDDAHGPHVLLIPEID